MNGLYIRQLKPQDSTIISNLLLSAREEYILHFSPFAFDNATIIAFLESLKENVVFGLFVNEQLAGFHMLRGWDEGYSIPAYGVFIAEKFKRKGLSKISMYHAISYCKLNKVDKLMLKVAKENIHAKTFYESVGFSITGIDPKNHHLIYHKNLD